MLPGPAQEDLSRGPVSMVSLAIPPGLAYSKMGYDKECHD